MYLFEDINNWSEFRCEICNRVFKSWRALSKHVQQQPNTHPTLYAYKKKYFPRGYVNGLPPNNKALYVLCDPEKVGDYKYNVRLFGKDEILNFEYEPIYVGQGVMGGTDARYRLQTGEDCNKELYNRIQELIKKNIKPIIYVVAENLLTSTAKNGGEKILIPIIGRRNDPNPSLRGSLYNKNSGGDGYNAGELSQTSRDKMSNSRQGNKNRCDTWLVKRISDGLEITTENLREECDKLGLSINRMHEVASPSGKQKTHRGYICINLTRRKSVGGTN